jgi:hypothetical protein
MFLMHAVSPARIHAARDFDCPSTELEHRISQYLIWPVHIVLAAVNAVEASARSAAMAAAPGAPAPAAAHRSSSGGSSGGSSSQQRRHYVSEPSSLSAPGEPRRGIGRHTLARGMFGGVVQGSPVCRSPLPLRADRRNAASFDCLDFD